MNQLAYNYVAVCNILESYGYSDQEIAGFLKEKQNPSGYIASSELPPIKKGFLNNTFKEISISTK